MRKTINKFRKNMTLSYGLRFESQTQIHDHADFGPRTSYNWAISGGKDKAGKDKAPFGVVRAGFGIFYTRFESTNVLLANRQNGVNQTEVVANNPDFFPDNCSTNPTACSTATAVTPTIYQIGPRLRAPYIMITGIGLDKPLGKHFSISGNYMYSHGDHLLLTDNINAPLPGTYNPADPTSGTRPLGTDQNIYQFQSEGESARNRLIVNGNAQGKNFGLFGFYMLSKYDADTSGSFPSNPYDIKQDYGRGQGDVRNRLFIGGFSSLPFHISVNPFLIFNSGVPFNITTGTDLNGDTQFNDRPAFATDLTRPSVYKTKYGNFDAVPLPGSKIIPMNYGNGPSLFVANMRLERHFNFGPVVKDDQPEEKPADDKDAKKADDKDAKNKKPVKKEIPRKYSLAVGVGSDNIFNHVNLAPPIAVLGSPLFGKSTSLATVFGNGSANRTVNLETFFRF